MRLIDADKLKEKAFSDPDTTMSGEALVYVQDIDNAPTIDAVPVVRCKNCQHYWKNVNTFGYSGVCTTVSDDDFCSYGERKDGDG